MLMREALGPPLANLATSCLALAADVVRAVAFHRLAADKVRADVGQVLAVVEILQEALELLRRENVVLRRERSPSVESIHIQVLADRDKDQTRFLLHLLG